MDDIEETRQRIKERFAYMDWLLAELERIETTPWWKYKSNFK